MTAAALIILPVLFVIVFALFCAIDGTTTHSKPSDNPEVIRYTANGKVTNGSLLKR